MLTAMIVLVGLALVVSAKALKGDRETQGKVTGGLAVVLVVLVVLRFTACSEQTPLSADVTVDRNGAVGWRLGTLVAEACPDGGKVVVLQAAPTSDILARVAESQLAGLRTSLPEAKYELAVHQPGFLAGPDPRDAEAGSGGGDAKSAVEEMKAARAIVSFAPVPVSPAMQSTFPPFYLYDAMGSGFWVPAMKAGVVQAAVTTHRDSARINLKLEKGSPQERFDAIYEVYTPENVDTFK